MTCFSCWNATSNNGYFTAPNERRLHEGENSKIVIQTAASIFSRLHIGIQPTAQQCCMAS